MEEVVGGNSPNGDHAAVAESCTGGLIGHRSHRWLVHLPMWIVAAVCYSNRRKTEMLGVPAKSLSNRGGEQEVAAAMACGIRERANVSVGLSVTGIAGQASGPRPAGRLVYVGLDDGTDQPITQIPVSRRAECHQTTLITSRIGFASPLVAR